MAGLIADSIDFSAYEKQTEFAAAVKSAARWGDELAELAAAPDGARTGPSATSLKMADDLEFRPGEITVWAGYSGHRKSMVTGQVALDLCAQDQRVMMASLEMRPTTTLQRCLKQAASSWRTTVDQARAFSSWTDGRLWLFDHVGTCSPKKALAVCRYFAEVLGGHQVILDSLMMICESEESMDEQKKLVTSLVRLAQESMMHVHLIAHCRKPQSGDERRPTKYDVRGSSAITDQAHNVVMVYSNKPKERALRENPHDEKWLNEPDMTLHIDKQREGAFEGGYRQWVHRPSGRIINAADEPLRPAKWLQAGAAT